MRVKTMLALFALMLANSVLADPTTLTNPPSECSAPQNGCGCNGSGDDTGKDDGTDAPQNQNDGDSVDDECIKVWLGLGRTTPWTGSMACSLKLFADNQSPQVFTVESLHAVLGGYTFKRLGHKKTMPDGVTPAEVVFSHPRGESVHFVFRDGESLGRPDPGIHVKMDERLMMVDAEGWATASDPVYYDLYLGDGTRRRFLATNRTGALGQLVSITDSRGVTLTPTDMGVDILYGSDGVRQFLTPSRLADVTVQDDGYDVAVYPLQDIPAKDAATGLYALPPSAPVKRLSIRSGNGGNRAVVTVRRGDGEPRTSVFDYSMGEWSLTRPSGTREEKERHVQDSKAAQTVKEVLSTSGERLSRRESNFKWMSWGFAMTNRVEGFGDATDITTWTYYTSGNGKGQIKTERRQSGLFIQYAYDDFDRLTSETRSGPDMMAETTTYDYTPVDAGDAVLPVDTRPRTVVRTLNNIECGRSYYVYSPLTNIVERVVIQGAAYGGTNSLRTVTAFYPTVANDMRSGFVKSIRREDGRLDLYDYALSSNVWTKTVTHLHEQSPSPVSGKTTRDVTLTNARGEVVETRTEAFIGEIWYTIARNRMTYNSEGKRIASENLAGQVTTTAWDCCHKISETQPDGSTTTWDYDDEGRMVASSRLIPLDMTNVTWLTTCYEYDDLGRQTATWQTNYAAQVGLPATRTRYDVLGRVVAHIDTLGNTTTTTYSPDGRTLSVLNPNTSTRIATRSASGDILSITGSAVTPEFHTYGILSDGTRWSRTVQGETASSPRFTKRYENLLRQTVREERSGFRGAVLATVNTYDALGRLVSTAADYEPTTEYTYDTLGNRVATTRTVGRDAPTAPQITSPEWRKTENTSSFSLIGDVVWLVQTNIVSCSDSTIAPLVTSTSRQLTGLTPALPSRSQTIDVRGNVTVNETLIDSAFVTSRQTLPYATNKPLSISCYGINVQDVSVSAVTNSYAYDFLGRQIAHTDGRGNTKRIEYDMVGRKYADVDAIGNRTTYAYDRYGNLTSVTDPLGHATLYEYDLRGRKTYEGGATYPVRYTYDAFGNKTTMMTYRNESQGPDSGDVTIWLYDEASGCMTNKVYADGKGPTYSYTVDGRLSQRIWARGIVTDYSYDNWGNLTNTVYSDDTPTVSQVYDAMGRQIEARDAAGVTTFLYDSFGTLTNETVTGVAGKNAIERFYDAFGRNVGYALNGTRQSTLAYDSAAPRLLSMQVPDSNTQTPQPLKNFTWAYLPGSDLKSLLAYPNGLTASWQYDANNQLLQVGNATMINVISQYDYVYDAAGRRIEVSKSGSAFTQDETIAYGYNNRSELTNAVAVVDSDYRYAYDFDNIGNRETASERGTNALYTANQLNQHTSISNFASSAFFATEFIPQFDDDGNQILLKTATGIWSVTYNGENRPIYWSNGDAVILMSYDRMGRRVTKNDQRFVYDGYLQIADNVGNSYIWDPTEIVATRPLMWDSGDSISFYTHDGNKNVREVVSENCETITHYDYAPFGAVEAQCGGAAVSNPWRFSSEYAEDDTATVYYNFRHYESALGRWLSRDPIGEIVGVNLFSHCRNRQMQWTDNLGLSVVLSCNESEFDTTIGGEFNVGIGKISIFFNNHLRSRICDMCCDDGTRGQTVTSETSNGGGGGGTWRFMVGPIPAEAGFSYLLSGGEVEFYDTCSGLHTFDGCKTVSFTLSAGPSAMVGGVGFALIGNVTITSTSCLGKDEPSKDVKGKLVFRICYLPGTCQTKDIFP